MSRETLLVLGAAGQLARALASAGNSCFAVTAIGRPALDLADPKTLKSAIERLRPRTIINAAAYTAVDRAEEDAAAAFAVNEAGAANAARCAREAGADFIHISTDYVFDGTLGRPYREADEPNPRGVYARSKLAGEKAVRQACPDAAIVRVSGVYDAEGRNFVRAVAGRLAKAGEAKIVNDQRLTPSYAPDLAAGLLTLAERRRGGAEGALYHIAGGEHAVWFEIGEAIAAYLNERGHAASVAPTTTEAWGAPAPRPADSRLDCSKFETETGLRLPSWRTRIGACIDSVLNNEGR